MLRSARGSSPDLGDSQQQAVVVLVTVAAAAVAQAAAIPRWISYWTSRGDDGRRLRQAKLIGRRMVLL
ncbi:unnamed protein product [Toxocara canis]|uniref:Secreted protein n=1 Tax=Toxocara canis TaxID=6265 RepID=A0A183U5C8_TOXCA|nr:unnamed protein product [Toxocara canis]